MTQPAAEDDQGAQGFLSHLVELRSRLLYAIAAWLLLALALIPFGNRLYALLAVPFRATLPEGAQMIAIDPASPFFTPLKLSFFAALVIAMPWILYQLWAFVAPGLYRHEQKLAMPLLVSSTLLFYLGCAFAYYLVLPVVFGFMQAVAPEGVEVMTDISRYLDFVLVIFLAFGVTFEVPVATVILVALGWVTVEQLKAARSYMIVAAFVIAAVLTPPDIVSQLLLAIPMCVLYEIGIVAARLVVRGNKASG
ncbi:MAG: twin-arginine translocase subunit TatC [Xanthomonadales bacterium]|nr:Sec-independent protein translocase protein TatC [Xanthomonadales bacterium]MCC6592655.1 twin-arginine translocase subunit TatC [Xanthomonadales bacterium]MCE7931796.1 twin-arginine translocase subunit TatC [Xanthomonadales bacterium PRO6]